MVKILSKSGDSLADVYDVVGSVAGIEQLESREVSLAHDMAATLFSERYSFFIRSLGSGNIAQSTEFNVVLLDLPTTPTRLFGLAVIAQDVSRIALCNVSVVDPGVPRDMPIWVWDQTNSVTALVDTGSGPISRAVLVGEPSLSMLPIMCGGSDQPQAVEGLALRGITTAFGAGTVFVDAHAFLGFSQVGGISSRGLPIPSW